VSELELNVPFQHKHGYIRDDKEACITWGHSHWHHPGIPLNRACAAAMRPFLSGYFDHLL